LIRLRESAFTSSSCKTNAGVRKWPTPGSIKTALERIRAAATPERVTRDFVATVLQIKGGAGFALIPYLKKIGFVGSDGSPTELYKRFRNPTTGAAAVAQAVKGGYEALANINEYFYKLSDKDLLNLIVQVSGAQANDQVAKLTLSTLKTLKTFADFDAVSEVDELTPAALTPTAPATSSPQIPSGSRIGLNLGYTFNLNLPATSDQAVFNAIFRSLKENLLTNE
jgi:hypothetical protein